ncbi:MAG: M24 family metallopeptidase C-terminal domain-containing protein, partial [Deltaproteobacteria bacterium]
CKIAQNRGLNMAPIDRRLIVRNMLSPSELDWLNAYHARVQTALAPLLDPPTRLRPFEIEPSPWTVAGSGVPGTERCRP